MFSRQTASPQAPEGKFVSLFVRTDSHGAKMEEKKMEKPEVLLKENSDGLQCTERMTRCKDAVCYIYAYEGENIR